MYQAVDWRLLANSSNDTLIQNTRTAHCSPIISFFSKDLVPKAINHHSKFIIPFVYCRLGNFYLRLKRTT